MNEKRVYCCLSFPGVYICICMYIQGSDQKTKTMPFSHPATMVIGSLLIVILNITICQGFPLAMTTTTTMMHTRRNTLKLGIAWASQKVLGLESPGGSGGLGSGDPGRSAPSSPGGSGGLGSGVMNDDPGSEPVVVFGCDGETGMRVVDVIISHGVPVRLVHHTSIDPSKKTYPSHIRGIPVQHVVARVEIAEEVANAVKGSRAVVCTVGIQPVIPRGVIQDFDTGDAGVFAVGYANLAQMCIKYRVPRLVVLDSTCTYPSNTCRSMVRGEKAIRATYSRANGSENKLGYSIVRSGRLYNGEERGPQEIEVHQGKEKSGLLSRQDAAHMLAEEALDPKLARTTVEAYYTDSAQPTDMGRAMDLCKKNGVSMKECFLGKQKNGRSVVFPTTKEHHSDGGWRNLFKGVREDQDLEEEEGIPDVETYFGVDSN